jgi:myo-inositol-1(or 4)-monophosphatase
LSPEEWERYLLRATKSAEVRVSRLAKRGDRGRKVGIGAAGDNTIYADKEAEEELLGYLNRVRGVKILSEEAGEAGDRNGKVLAVVDPLDGSSNFEKGIPFYCTSVAIANGKGLDDLMVGVVRDFVTGDSYAAVKGGGARKNGRAIRTSSTRAASSAVVGVDLSRSSTEMVERLGPLIAGVKRQVHLGANALELCFLAEGKTDAFVDIRGSIRITDFAGAYLIAREAGAVFSDEKGDKLNPTFDLEHRFSFVASAGDSLHGQILGLCGMRNR